MKKAKVAILGTGNIGSDLLIKIMRSEFLECTLFAGRDPNSRGIRRAQGLGVRTSSESIQAIVNHPEVCDIVFDATSAQVHLLHAPVLKKLKKIVIDLTPSQNGKPCVPVINMRECLDEDNVNLITCGGQAVLPIVCAIVGVHPQTPYIEVVASISSKSAGSGTRANIDEFTQTTRDSIISFTRASCAKAIIILNPAEPPVLMHNTIYVLIKDPDINLLRDKVRAAEKMVQEYVPGYKVTLGPIADGDRVTTMIEVVGLGDYLPRYSGNLDIMTCAAVRAAEEYAKYRIIKSHAMR